MYVKNKNSYLVNDWQETELNKKRIITWNLEVYNGEVEEGYDGKLYVKGYAPIKPTEPEPTYKDLRREAYPSIEDQLDMIYWDKVNWTNTWQESIQAVKDKYPKPIEEIKDNDGLL